MSLEYIIKKFDICDRAKSPIEIEEINRKGLPSLFNELGFKIGAEIGVETGEFSELLCQGIPGLQLSCVDSWKAYRKYRDFVHQEKLDEFYEKAKERLTPYGCTLIREYSLDAVKNFKKDSLDFVYIDSNHEFEFIINDIIQWSKIVRSGGIVAGHDYWESGGDLPYHVVMAVQAYVKAYKIKPWFLIGKRYDKEEGNKVWDRRRSFMWVKP